MPTTNSTGLESIVTSLEWSRRMKALPLLVLALLLSGCAAEDGPRYEWRQEGVLVGKECIHKADGFMVNEQGVLPMPDSIKGSAFTEYGEGLGCIHMASDGTGAVKTPDCRSWLLNCDAMKRTEEPYMVPYEITPQ